jgi:hypothetical protein
MLSLMILRAAALFFSMAGGFSAMRSGKGPGPVERPLKFFKERLQGLRFETDHLWHRTGLTVKEEIL